MKRWFPKTLLSWREPPLVTRWRVTEELRTWTLRGWLLWGALSVLFMASGFWEASSRPSEPPEGHIAAGVGIGLFMLFLPILQRGLPSFAAVTETAIRGASVPVRLDDILRCDLEQQKIGERWFWILVVTRKDGSVRRIGIAERVSLVTLKETLRGLRLEVGDTPSVRDF